MTTADPEPTEADFVTQEFPDGGTWTDITRLTDGRVMCCLCFGYFTRDQLAADPDHPGCVVDVCKPCHAQDTASPSPA